MTGDPVILDIERDGGIGHPGIGDPVPGERHRIRTAARREPSFTILVVAKTAAVSCGHTVDGVD